MAASDLEVLALQAKQCEQVIEGLSNRAQEQEHLSAYSKRSIESYCEAMRLLVCMVWAAFDNARVKLAEHEKRVAIAAHDAAVQRGPALLTEADRAQAQEASNRG